MRLKPLVAVAVAAVLASVVAVLGSRATPRAPTPGAEAPSASASGKPRRKITPKRERVAATYASLVSDLDRRIEALRPSTAAKPKDWLLRGQLATSLMERASLTNQIDDFERAKSVLDEGFAAAPEGSGPLVEGARYYYSIHRLDVAERYVDKIAARAVPRAQDKYLVPLMRSQIALQRGEYDVAFEGFALAESISAKAAYPDLALYYAKTGDGGQAEEMLIRVLETVDPDLDPRLRAWLRLQYARIAMDRGDYREALTRLADADEELPGWWMVEEQMAEAHGALGDNAEALAAYEKLVEKTGLPQLMDSLAAAYQHAGQKEKAQPLIDKAGALWEDHIKRLPEASMGHGLFHYLQFGPPEKALELARINYEARPGLESPVLLARALLKNGKNEEALEVAKKALATKYVSASVHDVASKAYAALGDTANADAEREKCFAINPWYQDTLHSH